MTGGGIEVATRSYSCSVNTHESACFEPKPRPLCTTRIIKERISLKRKLVKGDEKTMS